MGIIETLIKESTKKTAVKVLGDTVGKIAVTTADSINKSNRKYNNKKTDSKNNDIDKKYAFVPFSSDEYFSRNYKDIMEELSAYGFANIALLQKRDLIKGWITKDGEVEKIVINGKEKFRKNAKFEQDARVVITYHTFKKLKC